MKLVDANVLIYAVNSSVPQHEVAREWLDRSLNGSETIGFDWVALLAFVRLTSRPGILPAPLAVKTALDVVGRWLDVPVAQVLAPTPRHLEVLGTLLAPQGTGGNRTTDAHLAALAIEHRAELWTFDRDFASFPGLAWRLLEFG